MRCLTHLLQETTVARWYAESFQDRKDKRADFIDATLRLLASASGPIGRADVVRFVGGSSSSTFYYKFGRKGPGALVGMLGDDLQTLATGGGAFDNHLVEVRVASYWSYRTGWLDALRDTSDNDRAFAAETLVLCVARWASDNPTLSSLGGAAPIAAVEDLMVITARPGQPLAAASLLSTVVKLAGSAEGESIQNVLEFVRDDLCTLVQPAGDADPDGLDMLVTRLGKDFADLRYQMSCLPPQRVRQMVSAIRPQLRLALDLLDDA